MIERNILGQERINNLPKFPNDVSPENCNYVRPDIGGMSREDFLTSISVESNNVVANCSTLSGETTRMAVVAFGPETEEAFLLELKKANDGVIKVDVPGNAEGLQLRFLFEKPEGGEFYIGAEHNGVPTDLREYDEFDQEAEAYGYRYAQLLSELESESPKDSAVINLIKDKEMNPRSTIELYGRYFYPYRC